MSSYHIVEMDPSYEAGTPIEVFLDQNPPSPAMPPEEPHLNPRSPTPPAERSPSTPPYAPAPSSAETDSSPTTTATTEESEPEPEPEPEPEKEPEPDPDAELLAELLPKVKAGDLPGLIAASPLSPTILTKIAVAAIKTPQHDIFSWTFTQDPTLLQETSNNAIYNAACSSLSMPIFKILVDQGLDLNTYHSLYYGDALTCACMHGNVTLVKWLLDNGHDPNLGRRCGDRPAIVWAVTCPQPKGGNEILHLLLKHQVKVEETGAAIAAAEKDNLDALVLLLNAGAGLEEKVRWWGAERQSNDEEGTALFRACVKGRAQTVEYLLGRGAKKDTEGYEGSSCWDVAEKARFVDVLRLLHTMGVTVEWPD